MEAIYTSGAVITAVLFGSVWLMCLLAQVGYCALRWVNDEEAEVLKPFQSFAKKIGFNAYCFDNADFWLIYVGLGACSVLLFVLLWPIVYPVLVIYGILYGLRVFVRFKKKINLTVENKADKQHKHNQDDIILKGE